MKSCFHSLCSWNGLHCAVWSEEFSQALLQLVSSSETLLPRQLLHMSAGLGRQAVVMVMNGAKDPKEMYGKTVVEVGTAAAFSVSELTGCSMEENHLCPHSLLLPQSQDWPCVWPSLLQMAKEAKLAEREVILLDIFGEKIDKWRC